MLNFLFRRLTTDRPSGTELFEAVTAEARRPRWYREGEVADTVDGRFAVLSTISALVLVRLEILGEAGNPLSVAFTERFIQVMEAEHREMGLGDPTLGKTVRKLVASLARRVELWRTVEGGDGAWSEATRESLYKDVVSNDALAHSAEALAELKRRLANASLAALSEGEIP